MKVTVIKVSMLEGKGYDAMKPLLFAIMDTITPEDIEEEEKRREKIAKKNTKKKKTT